jgi:hypothetical protein
MWLNAPNEAMQAIVMNPVSQEIFLKYCKTTSKLYETHFDFAIKYYMCSQCQGQQQMEMIRKVHRKKRYNSIFYCTYTEILYGSLDQTIQQNGAQIWQEMTQKKSTVHYDAG